MKYKTNFRYQILTAEGWIYVKRATVTTKGWLDYELRDGTRGLKRPETWRLSEPPPRN